MFERSVPVLMYHHVSPSGRELNIFPDFFEEQLNLIQRKGWQTLSGDEFLNCFQQAKTPGKKVLITFDDGFADNYIYAYPLLKKYGMKALLFVTTSIIKDVDMPRTNYIPLPHREAWQMASTERCAEVMCTWRELKEMEESGTFDVQAHGMTHNTPSLIKDGKYDELKEDLLAGKKTLEEKLSKEIHHLAWPKGVYDKQGIELALNMGFRALYTTERGANTQDNLTQIRRLPVKNKGGKWLYRKLKIYSSSFLSRVYLSVRTGV